MKGRSRTRWIDRRRFAVEGRVLCDDILRKPRRGEVREQVERGGQHYEEMSANPFPLKARGVDELADTKALEGRSTRSI